MNRHLLRRSRRARRTAVVFMILWTMLLLGLKISGSATSPWLVIVAGVVAAGVLARRMTAMGVDADDERLVVRNFLRTKVIDRRHLDGFRIGRAPTMPFEGTCVQALTSGGGIVAVTITARLTRFTGSRSVNEDLATLRAWQDAR